MDEKATISLVIGGWTYTAAFPSARQDQDTIVCSGQAHFVIEEDDEVIEKELYLEIMRQTAANQKSTYLIKDDGIDVSIYVDSGDFSRIVAELKDQARIRECAAIPPESANASVAKNAIRQSRKMRRARPAKISTHTVAISNARTT